MPDGDDTAEATTADATDDEPTAPEPAVQSEALRRQQLFVGSAIAVLGGLAVTVATLQQLPEVPFVAALGGGLVTSALLFALLFTAIFHGDEG